MIKTKMRHFNKDWKQVDWKLSIARISFTEISNEFCLSVVGYSRGRGGKQKCFRTRNSRKFWISQFGTYKNGSCRLQEFHSLEYQANFATQFFLRQVPQRPWWPNDSSIYLRFKKFQKKIPEISLRILLIWNLFRHRLFFTRIGPNTLTRE